MTRIAAIITVVSLGLAAAAANAPSAKARRGQHPQSRGWHGPADAQRWHQPRGWRAPQGHFVVNANACAPLRHYHQHRGRHHSSWTRQRHFVLRCQPGAFHYVPTRAEWRMGVTSRHVVTHEARWDPRRQQFYADTRWGPVPVEIIHAPVITGRRYW